MKDFCDSCGWMREIVHVGQVKRKPPFYGFDPVKYCKECFAGISVGQIPAKAEVPLPPRDPEAVAIALGIKPKPETLTERKVPKETTTMTTTPEGEIYLMKLRVKLQWFATGLVTGVGIAAACFSLIYIQGMLHP